MTSRIKRFTHGLVSGYGAIVVNILYTIFSVRLALHYLGKEQFGLWALALQVAGYLTLLDLGMTSAISRFLADHKDQVNGGEYGSLLQTGALVFGSQGLLIAICGSALSSVAPSLLHIPTALTNDFRVVLIIITIISGFSIASRSFAAPLWAFQRMDLNNFTMMLVLVSNILMMWLGFQAGWGIYSLAYAGIPGAILVPLLVSFIAHKNGYYPAKGSWGTPRWDLFLKVFGFGKDVLLMSLGSQLVNATQIMILSRLSGLDSAATFSIGTKFFTMGQQFIGKILESSAPALTEIFIGGDLKKFRERFSDVCSITLFLATIGASGLILGNQLLVSLWTSGAIHWEPLFDLLLAILLIITSLSRCFVGSFGIIGNLAPVRYLYFLEGIFFIILAIPATRAYGIMGLLGASLVSHLSVTLVISAKESTKFLDSMISLLKKGSASVIVVFLVYGAVTCNSSFHFPSVLTYSLTVCILLGTSFAAWLFMLPRRIKSDLVLKIKRHE